MEKVTGINTVESNVELAIEATTDSVVEAPTKSKTWILVFVFTFLAFLVDGADLKILPLSLTALEAEWQLTQIQKGMLGTYTLVGMLFGGLLGGYFADKIGRVKTAVICLVFFSIGTAVLGASQSYMQFAIIRLISAAGIGGSYIACSILMAEYAPSQYRTTILGALQAAWAVGFIVVTLMASWIIPIYGWRWLYYLAILPVFLAVVIQFVVPEPPSWIAAKVARDEEEIENLTKETPSKKESALRLIFMDKATRRIFLLWTFTAGFLQFGYYGVSNWLPSYLEQELGIAFRSMAVVLIGSYIAGIIGNIAAGYAADKFGRRILYVTTAISAALFIPIVVFFHTAENIPYLLIILGFLLAGPYAINGTYMSESFATNIRGSAVGGAYNLGRIGALAAPVMIGFIAMHYSIGVGFLVVGIAYFLCGVIPGFFIKDRLYDPQE